jgi:hypothetical protein
MSDLIRTMACSPVSHFASFSKFRHQRVPCGGAQINDQQGKSLICEESGNDTFRFPQLNIESQKAAIRLFATLSVDDSAISHQRTPCGVPRSMTANVGR